MKTKLILVEDDQDLGTVLKQYLEFSDFEVIWFDHPQKLLNEIEILKSAQLIIFDVMLPEIDGFSLAKQLAKTISIPYLFLTAKAQSFDRVLGLKLGADDYITKPFDTELLLYKIKAILQRSAVLEDDEQEQFKISNIFFDSMLRQLRVGDNEYKLSPKENELLKLLCMHRNDFMPRDLALRKIWKKENYFTARSMDVYIAKLRKLLRDDEGLEIINVHGEGFRLLVKN